MPPPSNAHTASTSPLALVLLHFSVPSLVQILPVIGIVEQTIGAVQRDTASACSLTTVNAGTGPAKGPLPLCQQGLGNFIPRVGRGICRLHR